MKTRVSTFGTTAVCETISGRKFKFGTAICCQVLCWVPYKNFSGGGAAGGYARLDFYGVKRIRLLFYILGLHVIHGSTQYTVVTGRGTLLTCSPVSCRPTPCNLADEEVGSVRRQSGNHCHLCPLRERTARICSPFVQQS